MRRSRTGAVLRIEYYPTRLFSDDPETRAEARANQVAGPKSRGDAYGEEMQRLMNKVSRVTLWVEPDQKQIVKYTFENVSLDFLPASWLVRVTELRANMLMTEAFPGVWLPRRIDVLGSFVLARRPLLGQLRHPVLRLPRSGDLGQIPRDRQPPLGDVRKTAGLFAVALFLVSPRLAAQQEVVAAIQVHGNTITPADEIVRASGITVGDPVSETLLSDAEARLGTAMKFESLEVLKRFASISDPSRVLVLIQVDEGPVRVEIPDVDIDPEENPAPPAPRPVVVRRSKFGMMFVPILSAEDGYGFTYGAQVAFAGHRSAQRRIVVPASWGGDKRVGAEYQQEFSRRFAPRLRAGGLLQRRTHPFFEDDADRKRVWGRTEWPIVREIHAGGEVAWQTSSLDGEEVRASSVGADVVVDTRVDPLMPHNAIFVRSAVERLFFSPSGTAVRTEIDANGYVGLYRGIVLALRAVREDFSQPAPAFYKSMLGGSRNLRGFRAGYAVGDTLVAGSIELRIPATSPLRMARFGNSVFMDAGTTYDKGERFGDQKLEKGVGAGIWATAPLFRIGFSVARGLGSGTRVHIAAGLTF